MERTITVTQYECERCHHAWVPRLERPPRVCPVCKSFDWNSPRTPAAKKGKK